MRKYLKIIIPAVFIAILAICFLLFYPSNFKEKPDVSEKRESEVYRIGLIKDVHGEVSKDSDEAISKKAKGPLIDFMGRMNNSFRPDLIVENGDFIEGSFREGEKSIRDFRILDSYLKKIGVPVLHVVGNHEMRGLALAQWLELTNNESSYYYIDKGNLRIIVLDGNDKGRVSDDNNGYYHMSDEQLVWLDETLKSSSNFKTIVFIHFPLTETAIDGTQKVIDPQETQNLKDIISVNMADAVITGHTEKLNYEEIGGVEYFSLPGFSKSNSHKVPWLGCFYEVQIDEKISVKMFYKKSFTDGQYQELIIPSENYYKIEK